MYVRLSVLLSGNKGMGTGKQVYTMPTQAEWKVMKVSDTIIVSVISLVGSIIVAFISYSANRKGAKEASENNAKLIAYRLEQLEAKQDKHNSMIERMYKVEGAVAELQHEVKDLKDK